MTTKPVLLSLSQLAQLAEAAQLSVEAVRGFEALHAERWQLATRRRAAAAALDALSLREAVLFEVGAAELARKEAAAALAQLDREIGEVDAQLSHVEPRVSHSQKILSEALAPMTNSSAACRLPCYAPRSSDAI